MLYVFALANTRSRSRTDNVKTLLGRYCITGIREWEQDGLLVEVESGYMMYYRILLLGASDEFTARVLFGDGSVDLGALDVFIGVLLFVEGYVRLIYTPGEFIDLVLFFIFYLVTAIHQVNLFLFGAPDKFMIRVEDADGLLYRSGISLCYFNWQKVCFCEHLQRQVLCSFFLLLLTLIGGTY